jgi:DNA-binding transcriptional ArsR family regulator
MPSTQGPDAPSARAWRLLSSHGLVLFCISVRPGCTVSEISDSLALTHRSVYSVLGDLRRAGFVNVRKEGRRHHYNVNYGAIVGQSIVPEGAELRHVLRFLVNRTLVALDDDERPTVTDRRPTRAPGYQRAVRDKRERTSANS